MTENSGGTSGERSRVIEVERRRPKAQVTSRALKLLHTGRKPSLHSEPLT